jgi:outer membrane lipoprotein SlyB
MKALTCTFMMAIVGVSTSLVACNSPSSPAASSPNTPVPVAVAAPVVCNDCGTITNIEQMKAKGTGSGVGIVAGAVAGAVIGHQVGGGHGKDIATAAGAIGGSFAGNEIEKRIKGTTYFHVTVALENGGTHIADIDALNGLAVGSKVTVVGNGLQVAG